MTMIAYSGAVEWVDQVRVANAVADRAAWQGAFVAALAAAAILAVAWAAVRHVRGKGGKWQGRAAFLLFAVAATLYGGTKPSPVVTEKGIRITECAVDSRRASLAWETTDGRIAEGATFMVQARRGDGAWETMAETAASNVVIECFTVDRDTEWRIAVDAGEVSE